MTAHHGVPVSTLWLSRKTSHTIPISICASGGAKPVPGAILSRQNAASEDSLLPFKVDLVDWAVISPEFRAAIVAGLEPLP